mmetsp:Transcript_18946/g.23321  ORF Transcript_18946/g.23321 Transcript_18946/m.23321 type:complete len:163 (+) Transcript_18946:1-489(+)
MVLDYLRTIPNSFILDGFPRNLNQSKLFHQYYGVDVVIHFKLPHDILLKKLTGRRVCIDMPKCPGNFNIADINEGDIVMPSMSPKIDGICDLCGKELTQRPDDNEESIEERLKIYYDKTGPIEQYFKDSGLLLEYNIKKGIDDVPDIIDKMNQFINRNRGNI